MRPGGGVKITQSLEKLACSVSSQDFVVFVHGDISQLLWKQSLCRKHGAIKPKPCPGVWFCSRSWLEPDAFSSCACHFPLPPDTCQQTSQHHQQELA